VYGNELPTSWHLATTTRRQACFQGTVCCNVT